MVARAASIAPAPVVASVSLTPTYPDPEFSTELVDKSVVN
jgi:hypothetical protein